MTWSEFKRRVLLIVRDRLLPAGGEDGQVLQKASDSDHDVEWGTVTSGEGGGVTDHGALTGLGDDDHTQYHNDARGDVRYYTQGQVDTALSSKSDTGHSHVEADVTDLDKYTQAEVDSSLAGKSDIGHQHTESDITDLGNYAAANHNHDGTYSPATHDHDADYAAASHSHAASDVTSGTFADGRISQSSVTQHEAAIDHDALTGFEADEHLPRNDAVATNSNLWSSSKVQQELNLKSDTGHSHTESDVTDLDKYTQAEVDSALAGKSDTTHNHDGTYFGTLDVVKFTLSTTSGSFDVTWETCPFDTEEIASSMASVSAGEITFSLSGPATVLIFCDFTTDHQSGFSSRTTFYSKLGYHNGSKWQDVPDSYRYCYSRTTDQGAQSASVCTALTVDNGYKLRLQSMRYSGGVAGEWLAGGCSITIVRLA